MQIDLLLKVHVNIICHATTRMLVLLIEDLEFRVGFDTPTCSSYQIPTRQPSRMKFKFADQERRDALKSDI